MNKSDRRAARSREVDDDEPEFSFSSAVLDNAALLEEAHTDQVNELVREQVRNGSCNLVPFPRDLPTVPFRTELFSESLPIFVSNSYRGESWEWERSTNLPETNEPVVDRVIVGRVTSKGKQRGVLRQCHQDIWYRLLQIWDEQEYRVVEAATSPTADKLAMGVIEISAYALVMRLRGNRSKARYDRVKELLADLASIPVTRRRDYITRGSMDEAQFSLLASVEWNGRSVDRETGVPLGGGDSTVRIYLSNLVTMQFLKANVASRLLGPYLFLSRTGGRRNELAALLYVKLDRQLALKPKYHVKLEALLEELGCRSYRYKSQRAEKMQPTLEALNDMAIGAERYLLKVRLEESADKTDFVLHAWRVPPPNKPLPSKKRLKGKARS